VFDGVAYETIYERLMEAGSTYVFFLRESTKLRTLSIPEPWGVTFEGAPYGRFLLDNAGRLEPVSDFWRSDKCPVCYGVAAMTGLTADEATGKIAAAIARIPTLSPPPKTTPSPSPAPLPIARVAIDAGGGPGAANTATSLGARQTCSTVKTGGSLTIDVTVDAVPPVAGANSGITAFQFVLQYDPSVVKVVAADYAMLLGANPASNPISLSDGTPDSDGRFVVGVADFGDRNSPVSGAGVLARITLESVGSGLSTLTLSDVIIADKSASTYAVKEVLGAQIAAGQPCPQ
jgi:hypothetical protein